MNVHVDISVGPVQGFVAQSRRTRDLWGSSYLLSVLSAHAMNGARAEGGTIVRPRADFERDPLLQLVSGQNNVDPPPRIGSVPNHFIVEATDSDQAQVVADAAKKALDAAWLKVSHAVWTEFVEAIHQHGVDTKSIWERQVGSFWEFVWTAGPPQSNTLRRRKYWRSQRHPDEPGDKCMMMPGFQELSGYVAASGQRDKQVEFWKSLHSSGKLGPLDLRDEERLCAVALIKRLYPKIAKQALGWPLDVSHWRSTIYVGAVPWIRKVANQAEESACTYVKSLKGLVTQVFAEQNSVLNRPTTEPINRFARLDANYFHLSFIKSPRQCPLDRLEDESEEQRCDLVQKLKSIQREVGPAPVFYAIILADGDRLGELVSKIGGDCVGDALSKFTDAVPEIVERADGSVIYAGGDDLMAMVPVQSALRCVRELSKHYAQSFRLKQATATLSASVTFAHIRLPLHAVLLESRRLLDDIAKNQNGRDSLAVGVLKGGGLHCQWVSRWERRGEVDAVERILSLADRLRDPSDDIEFSTTLLHRIHQMLGLLCGWPQWKPGLWAIALDKLDHRVFLAAEVRRSLADRIDEGILDESVDDVTDLIVDLVQYEGMNESNQEHGIQVGIDALILAHFLSRDGVLGIES